jgi:cytochrome c553
MPARRQIFFARKTGGALTALLFCLSGAAAAGPPDISKAPAGASACLGCHGATETELPSLKNLSALDIETAMEAFRSGLRDATLMNRIAKGLTPEETRAIADWLTKDGRNP